MSDHFEDIKVRWRNGSELGRVDLAWLIREVERARAAAPPAPPPPPANEGEEVGRGRLLGGWDLRKWRNR